MAAFSLSKTPLRETGCLDIQFLIPLPFSNTVSEATFGYLPLTVQHQCYFQDAIPCQCSPNASYPTLT